MWHNQEIKDCLKLLVMKIKISISIIDNLLFNNNKIITDIEEYKQKLNNLDYEDINIKF